jgi:hypothetical protein
MEFFFIAMKNIVFSDVGHCNSEEAFHFRGTVSPASILQSKARGNEEEAFGMQGPYMTYPSTPKMVMM